MATSSRIARRIHRSASRFRRSRDLPAVVLAWHATDNVDAVESITTNPEQVALTGARDFYLPEKKRTQRALTKERDEKLCMVETGAGRTDRVYGMDSGWSPETFKVCGLTVGRMLQESSRLFP